MTTQSISHRSIRLAGTAAAALLMGTTAGHAADSTTARTTSAQEIRPALDIGRLDISPDIQLRRMVVRNASAKGTVLLLHGFPETVLAWHDVALKLGTDYEVHAFDWPGYGESSRPSADRFSYAPRDYANVLKSYVDAAGIDKRNLVIYATDIGALPALLAAIDDPAIARRIIVGDFAPFNRPQYMQERLQGLKDPKSAPAVRAAFNQSRDEILENAFSRGLPAPSQYKLSAEYKADLARGWNNGTLTSADAFYHYYANFTRDQNAFEATLARLQTLVTVVWGEQDIYIRKEMGAELAQRLNAPLHVLSGVGHYPHLQQPEHTIDEVRASFE